MSTDTPGASMRAALARQNQGAHLLAAACPSRAVLSHLTSRWAVLVLVLLLSGTRRFSELRREVGGVSEKMLAQTLEALAGDGFVLRQAYLVIPPKVEYSLTPLGHEAAERLAVLVDWIEDNYPRIEQARTDLATAPAAQKAA
ncbi:MULTISPECIES: winged helix-turn-helix transcriptional regulator [unclassified Janthinobacterium]|uniref:winged helix-turn-helix transcriptional regulator n=1 Tax=unclassified Janthinobacterium TaxID=2610881 RepID=UPI000C0EEDDC|nr:MULTISPECIES: helix-turn-helix domain-containing protein [unclassified Janthinobacterium]MDZ5635371.1 helix-turn-helix domain-containing protein [Janthinobacterium sp. GMG1]PHV25525.1 transcriptional regulator [Janthinobacterium sp. BJB426]